jgi:hypothetical protein
MEGVIGKVFTSKAGNPMVTIAGKPYVAKDLDVSKLKVGDRISYEGHAFGDGAIWALDSYKLLGEDQKYPPPQQPIANGVAPAPSNALLSVTDVERPCVSNWGAELIKAGVIKDRAELGLWVQAALHALRGN